MRHRLPVAFLKRPKASPVFFLDNFAGVQASAIASHASDSGASWTSDSAGILLDGAGGLYTTTFKPVARPSAAPANANYSVTATPVNLSVLGGNWVACLARYDSGSGTGYGWAYFPGTSNDGVTTFGTLRLGIVSVAGPSVSTQIGTDYVLTAAPGPITVTCSGTTIGLSVGGVVVRSGTNASITAAGVPAVCFAGNTGGTTPTTGCHLTNYSASYA